MALRIHMESRRGLVAELASLVTDADANIENVNFPERGGALLTIRFLIGVRDRHHLANVIRRVRRIPEVESIERS